MKIRITESVASATWSYRYGDVLQTNDIGVYTPDSVPAEVARKWISTGSAEPVTGKVETATLQRK